MNYIKSSVIAATLIATGLPAVYAVAAVNVKSTELTIHGTILSSTCTATFPTSVTIADITQNTYETAGINAQLGPDVTVGNVVFSGCDGASTNVVLTAKGDTSLTTDSSKGTFTYKNASAGNENPMIYTLGYTAGATTGNFDLSGVTPVSFTGTGSTFSVQQSMKVLKNATVADISKYAGEFGTNITYTADYK
ncbi:TPA: hypothetical protein O5C63_004820 [Salmonella enterica subsp. enterica serovar Mokola]|nr:hypothetical protein [Salmonella enterica subsp. enterica serovar Waycross]HDA4157166.1 hypothetical protein [Salmonella enterica subsp. enterica serovar Mokola]